MIIHHCVLSTIFHEEVGIFNVSKIYGLLYRKKKYRSVPNIYRNSGKSGIK